MKYVEYECINIGGYVEEDIDISYSVSIQISTQGNEIEPYDFLSWAKIWKEKMRDKNNWTNDGEIERDCVLGVSKITLT